MAGMSYNKLQIWNKAMHLTKEVYALTQSFPKEEMYGLTSQMRRCAVSVPSNIAEGSQRGSNDSFANFILIAKGSLAEIETQVIIARELNYVSKDVSENLLELSEELSRMLYSFHSKLKGSATSFV